MTETATIPRLYLPLQIRYAINDRLDFQLDGNTGITYSAELLDPPTIPVTRLDPESLLSLIDGKMLAASGRSFASVFDVEASRVRIIPMSGSVKLVSAPSGARNILPELGFEATGTAAFGLFQTAPYQPQGFWTPGRTPAGNKLAPRFDSYDLPSIVEGRTKSLRGINRRVKHSSPLTTRRITFEWLPLAKVITLPGAADPNGAFDRVWDSAKDRLRWWPDRETLGTFADYWLEEPSDAYAPERQRVQPAIYRLELSFAGFVS